MAIIHGYTGRRSGILNQERPSKLALSLEHNGSERLKHLNTAQSVYRKDSENHAMIERINFRQLLHILWNSPPGIFPILLISVIFAFGIGCVIGLVPAVLVQRYASLHGFQGNCMNYDVKPEVCQSASDQAQFAASVSNVVTYVIMLISNPVVGSISDTRGRRPVIILSLALQCIPSSVFVLLQHCPRMHPMFFYSSNTLIGGSNYLSIVFSSLSDVVAMEYRAISFGFLLAGFYGGFSLAPSIPILLQNNELAAAWISLSFVASAFFTAILFLPETLPDGIRQQNIDALRELTDTPTEARSGKIHQFCHLAMRPIREISILNRDTTVRLLAIGSFFSAMVFASDTTLVVYYIEDVFDVNQKDIARMFLVLGICGILVQACFLKVLIEKLGEKGLLVTSFVCGTIHNTLYSIARSKETIYLALIISQLTKTNFPIISSMASKDVAKHEQGRIQGALFAVGAIGNALGPLSMEFVYHHTKNNLFPGFMFLYAACLYLLGTVVVWFVPVKRCERISDRVLEDEAVESIGLEDPLLIDHCSS
jgi:DHA1 family tetracycline resistance protein-like MFS transporter